MSRRRVVGLGLVFGITLICGAMAAVPSRAGTDSRWFHLRVDERGPGADKVRINLPIKVIEAALPLLQAEGLTQGRIRVDDRDVRDSDLRSLLESARRAKDGEYVTMEDRDARVLVTKRDGEMRLQTLADKDGEKQQVTVRLPTEVLDALLSGPPEKLNLQAAIRVLTRKGKSGAISFDDEDSSVRIWIDDRNTSE